MTSHAGDLETLLNDPLFLTLSLLVKVSAGLFCGFDAKRHGRSPVLWFAVGFFLDLIGVVLWLIVRAWRPGRRGAGGAAGASERCPGCGSGDTPAYGFCPRCGVDRKAPATPPASPTPPQGAKAASSPAATPSATEAPPRADPEMTATCRLCARPFAPRKHGGGDRCPACELLRR